MGYLQSHFVWFRLSNLSILFLLSFAWRLTIESFCDGHPYPSKSQTPTVSPAEPGDYPLYSAVVNRQAGAIAAPAIAAIHQVGREAAARSAATNAANDAQHAGYWASQNSKARNNQGFSNYLLDQTVIQDNNKNTHGTAWNTTANALVEANPNRFQYVDTPNYWKGVDY